MPSSNEFSITIDPTRHTVTICGVKYAWEVFSAFGFSERGRWLSIMDRTDRGILTVERVDSHVNEVFAKIAAAARNPAWSASLLLALRGDTLDPLAVAAAVRKCEQVVG